MSWTNELYQVYENNCGKEDEKAVLLPVSHSTANAQIEVILSEQGEFREAYRIEDKTEAVTIIPVTEDSGSRGAGIFPHPLLDKFLYIAGDYSAYVSGKKGENTKYYQAYLKQLQTWAESDLSHPAVISIWNYLRKGTIIKDLISHGILVLDDDTGKLKENEKIMGIPQIDSFVRFQIEYEDLEKERRVWMDPSLYQSYIHYCAVFSGKKQLCYATGKQMPCTYKHPSKIRNPGDKAKLISSNDESGFSYRGRFDSKEQALSVSCDFSQKMHNALKWMIDKQGSFIGPMTLLMWESNLQPLPDIVSEPKEPEEMEDPFGDGEWASLDLDDVGIETDQYNPDTLPYYRSWLQKSIWGYQKNLTEESKAIIMILDAATTGRLSVSLYEEMLSSELFENMKKWHEEIAWHRYDHVEKKRKVKSFSLRDIVKYAYGTEQGDKITCKQELENNNLLRLIPCVIRQQAVPQDLVEQLVHKASNPLAYEHGYNWRNVLETACGLIRKKNVEKQKKEGNELALNKERCDRDYLYGRLLAVAEAAESSTYKKGEIRTTNAERLFEVFSNRPYQTWENLHARLAPYFNQMNPGQKIFYKNLLSEINCKFQDEEYQNNSRLRPDYLLAYYCQLNDIYSKKKEED